MQIQKNVPLSDYTSFQLGGPAEFFAEVHDTDELIDLLQTDTHSPIWLLGYGSNALISDKGLPGLVICMRGGTAKVNDSFIIADAGTWWDDVVQMSIAHNLWGIELMSAIPGSLGAALFINITAYGQSIGPRVEWVEVWDQEKSELRRIEKPDLQWDYKQSIFQKSENAQLVILRACLRLSPSRTDELSYQKAVDVADELKLDANDLRMRRDIIIEARKRAGSLWSPQQRGSKTAGSFFRNPIVNESALHKIMNFDESGKSPDQIKLMNQVHGGNEKRISAALVMLAAGFSRGQRWGNVKLNDQNLLKIEALPGATAQEVYNVALLISTTCQQKLGVMLEPEARILGSFGDGD